MKQKVIVILGPTASGKSALAVSVAEMCNGEIISADSRQVYKGLDIGTGKVPRDLPPTNNLKLKTFNYLSSGVPHHLLDIISPNRIFTVDSYAKKGRRIMKDILKRKKVPIICGGTGLYIDSLLGTVIWPEVKPNPQLRKKLEIKSTRELFELLQNLDPVRASAIDAKNPVRLIRAIEIATKLGTVPTQTKQESPYDILFIGLKPTDPKLVTRIHTRLLDRLEIGMLSEIKNLHNNGLTWKRMESLGLEYRYGARYLKGSITKDEMRTQLEKEIVQYSKRQMTWFKRNAMIHWFDPDAKLEKTIKKIVKHFLVENGK